MTNSPSNDSSLEEEHDWNSYLIETKSEAAPFCNFRQALEPPKNEFKIGDKIESVDPRNPESWCIGTIIDTDGPRLRIRLDGTDNRNDFWRLVDSSDIRVYGTTQKSGGQIIPPLGFQQNATRWAKYFEKNVKNGPFAPESCFKPSPEKPEKNLFKKGQKLEAVDPRFPNIICPATISNVYSGDRRILISLDGWSSANDFKIDYASRDIFPVGWCQAAGIRLAPISGNPNNRSMNKGLSSSPNKQNASKQQKTTKNKVNSVSPVSNESSYSTATTDEKNNNVSTETKLPIKAERKNANVSDDVDDNRQKERAIVTVYVNYTGDNSGMLLNPQKFPASMPSVFGPDQCHIVLTSILNACIRCAFQQSTVLKEIIETFPVPKDQDKHSYTKIILEKGTVLYISQLETEIDFWDTIYLFESGVLSCNELFSQKQPSTSTTTESINSLTSSDKNENSSTKPSTSNNNGKRKSTELSAYQDNSKRTTPEKIPRLNPTEKSVHQTMQNIRGTRQLAQYTPSDVSDFIKKIDKSCESLGDIFLREEIDGKALLLLTTETLMNHMGLKLGPALKIIHHIEQLKKTK